VQDPKTRLDKMRPLVKVRKIQLDRESMILADIRNEKRVKLQELKKNQQEYLQGIDRLNTERQCSDPKLLEVLESSVDYVKQRWYNCIRDLRVIEEKEKAQLANMMAADRNLKSVAKLEERYRLEFVASEQMKEQKFLDELAIRRLHKD
jgi:flagellar biosynthesis chaperone FliJ